MADDVNSADAIADFAGCIFRVDFPGLTCFMVFSILGRMETPAWHPAKARLAALVLDACIDLPIGETTWQA